MIGIELYNRFIDAGHSPRRRQHQRISQDGVARQLDRHAMRAENRVFGSVARSPDVS